MNADNISWPDASKTSGEGKGWVWKDVGNPDEWNAHIIDLIKVAKDAENLPMIMILAQSFKQSN